jgi:ATP synthase protein I
MSNSPDTEPHKRRVEEIEAQLKAVRATVDKPRAAGAAGSASSGMSHRQTSIAYRVMADMIAGLLVGGVLGYWLDRWMGWAPYALVVGLLVGFAAGANNAWRAIQRYTKDAAAGGDGGQHEP